MIAILMPVLLIGYFIMVGQPIRSLCHDDITLKQLDFYS